MPIERPQVREKSKSTELAARKRRRRNRIAVSAGGLAVAAGFAGPVVAPENTSAHADTNPAHVRLVANAQPEGLLVNLSPEQESPLQALQQKGHITQTPATEARQGSDYARDILTQAGFTNLDADGPEIEAVNASIDALSGDGINVHNVADGQILQLPSPELAREIVKAVRGEASPGANVEGAALAAWVTSENDLNSPQVNVEANDLLNILAQEVQPREAQPATTTIAPTQSGSATPTTTSDSEPRTATPKPGTEALVDPVHTVAEGETIKTLARRQLEEARIANPTDQMVFETMALIDALSTPNRDVQNNGGLQVGDQVVLPNNDLVHAYFAALNDDRPAFSGPADQLRTETAPHYSVDQSSPYANELLDLMAQDGQIAPHEFPVEATEAPANLTPAPSTPETTTENPAPQPTPEQGPAVPEPQPEPEPQPAPVDPEHRYDVHHVQRHDTMGTVAHQQLHDALGEDTVTSVTQERANFWTHVAANPQVTNIDLIFANRTNLHTLQDGDVRALAEAAEGQGDNQALIDAAAAIKNAENDQARRDAGAAVLRALGLGDPHRAEDGDPARHHGEAAVDQPAPQPTVPEAPAVEGPNLREDITITPADIDAAIARGVLTNETLAPDHTVIGDREAQLDSVAGHQVSGETVAAVSRLDQAASLVKYPNINFRSMADNAPYVALNDEVAVVLAATSQIEPETRAQLAAPEPVQNVLALIDALGNQRNVPENTASVLDLNVMDLVLRIPGDVPDDIYNQAGAVLREQDTARKQQLAREMLQNPLFLQAFSGEAVPPVVPGPDRNPNPGDPNPGTEPTTPAPRTPRTTAPETTTPPRTTEVPTQPTTPAVTESPVTTTPVPTTTSENGVPVVDRDTPMDGWWNENWNNGNIPQVLVSFPAAVAGGLLAGAAARGIAGRLERRRRQELLTPEERRKRLVDKLLNSDPLTEAEEDEWRRNNPGEKLPNKVTAFNLMEAEAIIRALEERNAINEPADQKIQDLRNQKHDEGPAEDHVRQYVFVHRKIPTTNMGEYEATIVIDPVDFKVPPVPPIPPRA